MLAHGTAWCPRETCWHCATDIQQRERGLCFGVLFIWVFFTPHYYFQGLLDVEAPLFPIVPLICRGPGACHMHQFCHCPSSLVPLVKQGHCLGYHLEFCSLRQTWVEPFLEELISLASEWVKKSIYHSWAPRDLSSACCWDLPCF